MTTATTATTASASADLDDGPIPAATVLTDIPAWGPTLLSNFHQDVSSDERPFPCTFAVSALRRDHIRFGFFDPAEPDCPAQLAETLSRFLRSWQDVALRTSLVCFFRPDQTPQTLASYCSRFWSVLQGLRHQDPDPWPRSIPIDPDNPEWEFCFQSTPIFVVCTTPAHRERASRWSPSMAITFQPRGTFAGLESDSAHGIRSRAAIRKRLADYDTVDAAPELQDYGDPSCREWRQYFLPDTNDSPGVCPFSSTSTPALGGPA